jgi:hypothetical protein
MPRKKKPSGEIIYLTFKYRHHVRAKECLFEIDIEISMYTFFIAINRQDVKRMYILLHYRQCQDKKKKRSELCEEDRDQ